jgi:hypothetical protein
MTTPAQGELAYSILDFDDLDGWADDDHGAALSVFRNTCMDMKTPDWASLCALAGDQKMRCSQATLSPNWTDRGDAPVAIDTQYMPCRARPALRLAGTRGVRS